MALKRSIDECGDGNDVSERESRRRLASSTVLRDLINGISVSELASRLEPIIRRVVRDAVEQAIQPLRHSYQRSTLNQNEAPTSRPCRLHFQNKLSSTLFTGSRIESDDGESIKILITDSSNNIITSGPLSSIKVEIVALDGDFGADDIEDWSAMEFNRNIVRERQGKRPLVTGELVITLRNGVGYIGDTSITDNSSWTRCRKFRLGARVLSKSSDGSVREARSEAFVVKDHRGESYKKHHPPTLEDEVWRIEKIAKDGKFHDRLALEGILTVKDFLQLYHTNPLLLRSILGGGISNKTWEIIINHVDECVLDDNLYMYCPTGETVLIVFNSVYKVLGAIFDGQNFQCLQKLNSYQMHVVDDLKKKAYKNLKEIVPFNEPSVAPLQANPFNNPIDLLNFNVPVEHQDQLGSSHIVTSPLYEYETEVMDPLHLSMSQGSHPTQSVYTSFKNSFTMREFDYGTYEGGYSSAPSGSIGSDIVNGNLAVDVNYQAETSMWQGNRFSFGRNYPSVDVFRSNIGYRSSGSGSPKAKWCKIRAAFKWGISVRRDVAAKRTARLLYVNF